MYFVVECKIYANQNHYILYHLYCLIKQSPPQVMYTQGHMIVLRDIKFVDFTMTLLSAN